MSLHSPAGSGPGPQPLPRPLSLKIPEIPMATGAGRQVRVLFTGRSRNSWEGGGGRLGARPPQAQRWSRGRAVGGAEPTVRRIAELGPARRPGRRAKGVPAQERGVGGLREAPGLELSLERSWPGRPWEPGGGGAQ